MVHAQLTSLRTRFCALLALGGSVVASGGLWITYTTTIHHFETQFVQQSILLAETLNHSAMVANAPAQVQHVVDQLSLRHKSQTLWSPSKSLRVSWLRRTKAGVA